MPFFSSSAAVAVKRGSVLVVLLEQLVVDLGLVDQVAAQVGFAQPRPVLVIGVADSCGTAMSGSIPPSCTERPDGV